MTELTSDQLHRVTLALRERASYFDVDRGASDGEWAEVVEEVLAALRSLGWSLHNDGEVSG